MNRQTDGQIDRWIEKRRNKFMDIQRLSHRLFDGCINVYKMCRQTNGETDWCTETKTDRQTDGPTTFSTTILNGIATLKITINKM